MPITQLFRPFAVALFTVTALASSSVAQSSHPWRVSLGGGLMTRVNSNGSTFAKTAALTLGRLVTNRVQLQAHVEAGFHSGDLGDVTAPCPACSLGPAESKRTILATAEALLFDQSQERGGYGILGAGMVRYSERQADPSRTRATALVGAGVLLPLSTGAMLFGEVRLGHTFDAAPFPRWTVPLVVGVRVRI